MIFGVFSAALQADRAAHEALIAQGRSCMAVALRKAELGQGDWVSRGHLHPMANVSWRVYRDRSGNIGQYVPGMYVSGGVDAWFFPWSDREIAERASPVHDAVEINGIWAPVISRETTIPKV